jgi:hypothetical protein
MKSADGRECSSLVRDIKIALSGKRTTKLYLLNPQEREVEKIEVDGCAISDGLRCDWLLLINDRQSHEEIYVELKSSKVYHAVEQLEATINRLSADRARLAKRCLVVFNRNPMTGTDVQRHKIIFQKNFNAVFELVRDGKEIQI